MDSLLKFIFYVSTTHISVHISAVLIKYSYRYFEKKINISADISAMLNHLSQKKCFFFWTKYFNFNYILFVQSMEKIIWRPLLKITGKRSSFSLELCHPRARSLVSLPLVGNYNINITFFFLIFGSLIYFFTLLLGWIVYIHLRMINLFLLC